MCVRAGMKLAIAGHRRANRPHAEAKQLREPDHRDVGRNGEQLGTEGGIDGLKRLRDRLGLLATRGRRIEKGDELRKAITKLSERPFGDALDGDEVPRRVEWQIETPCQISDPDLSAESPQEVDLLGRRKALLRSGQATRRPRQSPSRGRSRSMVRRRL